MHHWCALKILLPKRMLKLALNRNLCFLSRQTVTKRAGGCFVPHSHIAGIKHSLLEFLPGRSFSLTKTALSSRGQNRDKEQRQVLLLCGSLIAVLLLIIYANLMMDYHQDYVVIEPDDKK